MVKEGSRLRLRDRLYPAALVIAVVLFAVLFGLGIYRTLRTHHRVPSIATEYWDDLSRAMDRPGDAPDVAQLRLAAEIDHTQPDPYLRLWKAVEQSGDLDNQIFALQGLVRLFPDDAQFVTARAHLALIRLQQGHLAESVQHSRIAIRLDPENSTAHCNLAAALLGLGQEPEAAEHFREALRLDPTSKPAQEALEHALKGE